MAARLVLQSQPGCARSGIGAHGLLRILDDQLHLPGIQLLGTIAERVPLKAA